MAAWDLIRDFDPGELSGSAIATKSGGDPMKLSDCSFPEAKASKFWGGH
jgi:hypothetical protein